jgi:hypothetical protein
MVLSQAILPLNRKHTVPITKVTKTSLNCRRKILPSPIMSSSQPGEEAADVNRKLATEILKTRLGFSDDKIHRLIISDDQISHIIALGFPTEPKENFDLFPNMPNCEEAADLNRNITTEILKTKLGFSNDEIHRLIGDEISIMMEGKIMDKIMKIPTNEILAITEAEIYKLPFSKRIRLVKAFIVQEYPFAKFLVSLFMRTNPREEEDDKEPVPSAAHHFSAPLPPQQTHRFPLSIVVPLGITFVFGAIYFISSKVCLIFACHIKNFYNFCVLLNCDFTAVDDKRRSSYYPCH